MLIASYIGDRKGLSGIENRLIRWRFGGKFFSPGVASHTEIIFEPTDNVADLMPDGSCQPRLQVALWSASSSIYDIIPEWAPRRQGKTGGVRFKRIVFSADKWEITPFPHDARKVAKWFRDNEGLAYDWGNIFGSIFWYFMFFVDRDSRKTCSTAAAAAAGLERSDFYHPELLRTLYRSLHAQSNQITQNFRDLYWLLR